jgi:hypothetical protein
MHIELSNRNELILFNQLFNVPDYGVLGRSIVIHQAADKGHTSPQWGIRTNQNKDPLAAKVLCFQ